MAMTMTERAEQQRFGLSLRTAYDDADDRLRQLILYIAQQCEGQRTFGATKLNKILYYSDFISYARYGEPITGALYMRLPNGPAPVRLLPVRDAMVLSGDIVIRERKFYQNIQLRIIALTDPDIDTLFKPRDIALVDEVIRTLSSKTAAEVSDLSHGIAWKIAGDRELIPYESILLAEPALRPQDVAEGHDLIRKYGWGNDA